MFTFLGESCCLVKKARKVVHGAFTSSFSMRHELHDEMKYIRYYFLKISSTSPGSEILVYKIEKNLQFSITFQLSAALICKGPPKQRQ